VHSNPFPWNGLFISAADHTSGSGLIRRQRQPDQRLRGVGLRPDRRRSEHELFLRGVRHERLLQLTVPDNSPSILEFSVAGLTTESLGTATTNLALAGTWEGLSKSWNSGLNTSVSLSLINRNTAAAGNDFAIDDVFLGTTSTVTPVPEPETYALMLAGLGAMGVIARRRRKA
jgi:hypothetical protein